MVTSLTSHSYSMKSPDVSQLSVLKHWNARVKIRVEMKKLVFNFGKSVSQSLARKMAREGVTYSKIEELYLKVQSLDTFSKSVDGMLKAAKTTKEKLFRHFLQFSKRQTSG